MKSTFICGYCKKKTVFIEKLPPVSREGKQIKCPSCKKWQPFDGTMEVVGE